MRGIDLTCHACSAIPSSWFREVFSFSLWFPRLRRTACPNSSSKAGVRSSYGFIDPQGGETLRHTLDLALANNAQLIQLVTWNDYGEGTIIKPTEEFGYQYFEIVQETRRFLSESDFTFSADDLRLPLLLFNLRRDYAGNTEVNARLDQIFEAIVVGNTASVGRDRLKRDRGTICSKSGASGSWGCPRPHANSCSLSAA